MASADIKKIVVVNVGRRRRARYVSPAATPMIVPTAIRRLTFGGTVLSIANYNMHCGMDGWGRPYDYVAAIAALRADVIALEEAWTSEGDHGGGSAEAARWTPLCRSSPTRSGRGAASAPARRTRHLDRPAGVVRPQPALYMDGVRPHSENVQGDGPLA